MRCILKYVQLVGDRVHQWRVGQVIPSDCCHFRVQLDVSHSNSMSTQDWFSTILAFVPLIGIELSLGIPPVLRGLCMLPSFLSHSKGIKDALNHRLIRNMS